MRRPVRPSWVSSEAWGRVRSAMRRDGWHYVGAAVEAVAEGLECPCPVFVNGSDVLVIHAFDDCLKGGG